MGLAGQDGKPRPSHAKSSTCPYHGQALATPRWEGARPRSWSQGHGGQWPLALETRATLGMELCLHWGVQPNVPCAQVVVRVRPPRVFWRSRAPLQGVGWVSCGQ